MMSSVSIRSLLFIAWITIGACSNLFATHLRAADIRVERICGTLSFNITIVAYLNSSSNTQFGTDSQIIFGDGQQLQIPRTASTPRPDLGSHISIVIFSVTHTYSKSGIYTITYVEHDRSGGILNIKNSADVAYGTSVVVNADLKFSCNQPPVLSVFPLDHGCAEKIFSHNPGAFDADGDSLSYELTIPGKGDGSFADYTPPDAQVFYTDYNTGNEANDGKPNLSIDDHGQLVWDAPGMVGEYAIAFKIIEWKKDPASGEAIMLSSTIRDMQVIVEECANTRPSLNIPADICVIAGEEITANISGSDPEHQPVKIEFFSEILSPEKTQSPATVDPDSIQFLSSTPAAEIIFRWKTTCSNVRQQPYPVVIKITDAPEEGPGLVSFATWNIRVVPPAPIIKDVSFDTRKRHALVSWDSYECSATKIQIWRKVDSLFSLPDKCHPGIPANSGYYLIGETEGVNTTYTDTNFGAGLDPGASYCYRLVAWMGDSKSMVSDEYCTEPLAADAPVITHVTVEKTSEQGRIRVSWRSPLNINTLKFPEPYEYEIFRADDFIGESNLNKIAYTRDTTFVDALVNTKNNIYNYRIVVYARPDETEHFIPIDTSASASSVRLDAIPGVNRITLHWRDSVPWSNVVQEIPYHLIYRVTGISSDEELKLIDSVNVTENGFTYVDEKIESNDFYTYRVVTRGTYGNPAIALQQNSSQTVSLYPLNNLLPCSPIGKINITDCETYRNTNTCTQHEFTNFFSWEPDASENCRIDIQYYNVYASDSIEGHYLLLATVNEKSYSDTNLKSPARCYRISAVDFTGKEGPQSEPLCNDTCPFFRLPNVFTPGNDLCNDVFTSTPAKTAEETGCADHNPFDCPRFVNSVTLKVYNRWGAIIYNYNSSNEQSADINWDGRDEAGHEVASGIYYYVAEIDFETLDPAARHKVIKDWVQIIR
jgi:hypothetical protein